MESERSSQLQATTDQAKHLDVKRALIARFVRRAPLASESGFSLMEVVLAMTIFAIVATALLSVLVSGVSAQSLARQKTIGEQAATAAIESLRELSYSNIGNPGKNPNGTVTLSRTLAQVLGTSTPGLSGTVTTKVDWNNSPLDKVATSYRNAAFYKKVTVTVTRSDGKQLAQMVTFVSDANSSTGINDTEIDLSVLDLGTNSPVSGQDVNLTTGPSAPLTDTTDAAGSIIFPALTANPTSGATAYYNLGLTPLAGYTLLKDDDIAQTPSSSTAHVQLAPSQIWPTSLRVYKGSTVTVVLQNQATGTTYTGNATVTLSTTLRGAAASKTLSYSGGPVSTNTFASEPIIPSPSALVSGGYTAAVSNGFLATAVTKATVPNTYPTDLTSTFTLVGYPTGTLAANVTWAGVAVSGATVTLTGGPTGVNLSATTNASGIATFTDLPAGSGYTVTATKSGQSASSAASVTAGATTNVSIALPVGTIVATVTSGGVPVSGATVTVTGGPMSVSLSATTNASGIATFNNVPAGTGYTVAATQGTNTVTQTGVSVTGGSTTNVSIAMPVGTVRVTVTWAGVAVANCTNCVTISGGGLGSPMTASTDASGVATFNNDIPAGSGYTVTATKNGQSASQTGITVSSGATTNVSLALPVGTIAVTVTSGGSGIQCTNCVTISGGNLSASVTGSTNASGQVNFLNVPAGTGYTVTFTNAGVTATQTSVSVTNGGTTNVALTVPTGTLTVTVTAGGYPVQCTSCVTVSGGNLTTSLTGSTNSSGVVSFTVPAGNSYTVTATNGGTSASQSGVTVTGGATTNVALSLPTGTIRVTVTWAGVAVANCVNCVTVSGGGLTGSLTGSTDGSGIATFSNLPAASGYTVVATKSGQSTTQTGITVTAGATTNVSIALPVGTVAVTVTSGGYPIQCTNCVTISGGNLSASVTGSTNASGQVNFLNVPAGSGYTVAATNAGASGSQTGLSVTGGGTTNVTVTLPTGALQVTVTSAGSPVQCTNCVTVSGGSLVSPVTGSTNASGIVIFSTLPAGTGYTVTANNSGASASQSGVTITAGSTTNVALALPTGSVQVTVTWAGVAVANCTNCVTLSGGGLGSPVTGSTNGSGVVTFTNVPATTGYTVTATKNGQSANQTGITVTSGATTNVSIALPVGTVAVTVTWAGAAVANCTNCVTISGGNLSASVTGSTNASGQVNFINVPAGTGYTVSATKNGQTGSQSSVSVTGGSTTNVTVTLPTGTVAVTVTAGGSGVQCTNCVTISGGNLSASVTGSTNASGQVNFLNVPTGTGYTVSFSNAGASTSASSVTVTSGATTNVPLTIGTGTVLVTVNQPSGTPALNANVTLSGGNLTTPRSGTTNRAASSASRACRSEPATRSPPTATDRARPSRASWSTTGLPPTSRRTWRRTTRAASPSPSSAPAARTATAPSSPGRSRAAPLVHDERNRHDEYERPARHFRGHPDR